MPFSDESLKLRPEPRWWEDAACRGMNPDEFFAGRRYTRKAKMACAACPVKLSCARDAFRFEQGEVKEAVVGLRAGLSGPQRWRLYRQRLSGL